MLLNLVPSGLAQNVSIVVISSSEVLILWEPPNIVDQNGVIIGYAVEVIHTRTGQRIQMMTTSTNQSVDGLLPFTTYSTQVAARTFVGIGPYSIVTTFLTEEAGI